MTDEEWPPTESATEEWRPIESVKDALDIEGRIIGVTVHREWVGFKTLPPGHDTPDKAASANCCDDPDITSAFTAHPVCLHCGTTFTEADDE